MLMNLMMRIMMKNHIGWPHESFDCLLYQYDEMPSPRPELTRESQMNPFFLKTCQIESEVELIFSFFLTLTICIILVVSRFEMILNSNDALYFCLLAWPLTEGKFSQYFQ